MDESYPEDSGDIVYPAGLKPLTVKSVRRGLRLPESFLGVAGGGVVVPLADRKNSDRLYLQQRDDATDNHMIQLDPQHGGPKLTSRERAEIVRRTGRDWLSMSYDQLTQMLTEIRANTAPAAKQASDAAGLAAILPSPAPVTPPQPPVMAAPTPARPPAPVQRFRQSLFDRAESAAAAAAARAAAPPTTPTTAVVPTVNLQLDIGGWLQLDVQCHYWQEYDNQLVLIYDDSQQIKPSIPTRTADTPAEALAIQISGQPRIYVVQPAPPPLNWNGYTFYFLPIVDIVDDTVGDPTAADG